MKGTNNIDESSNGSGIPSLRSNRRIQRHPLTEPLVIDLDDSRILRELRVGRELVNATGTKRPRLLPIVLQ